MKDFDRHLDKHASDAKPITDKQLKEAAKKRAADERKAFNARVAKRISKAKERNERSKDDGRGRE